METKDTTRILLIEDNPGDALLIKEMLSESDSQSMDLVHAESLASGLARLTSGVFDCILLDLHLPDSQGIDTYAKVRTRANETAIIALTGLNDEQVALTLLREGIQDYLVKEQLTGQLLHHTICYAQDRIRATIKLISSEPLAETLAYYRNDCYLSSTTTFFSRFLAVCPVNRKFCPFLRTLIH